MLDLSYYETQHILSNDSAINVIHDKDAAVKYLTWNSTQCISYDDKDTFQQKRDWANSIEFSGSLIWASSLGESLFGFQFDRKYNISAL